MLGEAVAGSLGGAAALMAYAVRAPRSTLLGPSAARGNSQHRSLALTFDDGPSESTPEILSILSRSNIPATFFHCGANVRRLPEIARAVAAEHHEIGNHSDSHPYFHFRSPEFITNEFSRAQITIEDTVLQTPRFLRAPFGIRWFGFRKAQRQLGLFGVMWTVLAKDWKLSGPEVAQRLMRGASNGAIFCLHDGRELQKAPDISSTVDALRLVLPRLLDLGFRFETVHRMLCPKS